MLNDKYIKAVTKSPFSNNLTRSKEKVENVVKLPKKPTINRCFTTNEKSLYLTITAVKIPIRKEPTKFTMNVDKGNPLMGTISFVAK